MFFKFLLLLIEKYIPGKLSTHNNKDFLCRILKKLSGVVFYQFYYIIELFKSVAGLIILISGKNSLQRVPCILLKREKINRYIKMQKNTFVWKIIKKTLQRSRKDSGFSYFGQLDSDEHSLIVGLILFKIKGSGALSGLILDLDHY